MSDDGRIVKKVNECNLPKTPYSDSLSNMRASENYVKRFYDRLEYLRNQLKLAVDESDERKAGEAVSKVLGDKFPLPEKDKANAQDSFA